MTRIRGAAILAACLLCFLPSAGAVTINIIPGGGLAGNQAALDAFQRAANQWGSIFSDPVTVNINADLIDLGSPTILGQASSFLLQTPSFDFGRDLLVNDAADELSNAIVGALPTSSQFSAYIPAGFSIANSIVFSKANLKALGVAGLDEAFGQSDATIQFNSGFAFDFDNSDGVGAGLYDFETVAAHEIGHALGFFSAVDQVDQLLIQGLTGTIFLNPLDLFRFRASQNPGTVAAFTTTPRSLESNTAALFDDLLHEWAMSTGFYTGDGRQASHWRDDALSGIPIGLMDPTLAAGVVSAISNADIRALDLIGWDLDEPVPEPGTLAMLGFGLLVAIGRRRLAL